jgi:hypothetical protein
VNGCPPSGQLATGTAQFNASFANPSSLDSYSIRLDQVVSSKVNLFARYNHSPSSLKQRGASFTSTALSSTESLDSSVNTFTVGLTHLVTPRLSNEVRADYSNHRLGTAFALDHFGGAVPVPDSVLFAAGSSSNDDAFLLLISGAGEFGQGKAAIDEQRQINLIDNLSMTKGAHQLRFGVDYRWLSPFSSPFSYRQFADFSGVACPPLPKSCAGYALSGTVPGAMTTAFFAQPAVFQPISHGDSGRDFPGVCSIRIQIFSLSR